MMPPPINYISQNRPGICHWCASNHWCAPPLLRVVHSDGDGESTLVFRAKSLSSVFLWSCNIIMQVSCSTFQLHTRKNTISPWKDFFLFRGREGQVLVLQVQDKENETHSTSQGSLPAAKVTRDLQSTNTPNKVEQTSSFSVGGQSPSVSSSRLERNRLKGNGNRQATGTSSLIRENNTK